MICWVLHVARRVICGGSQRSVESLFGWVVVIQISLVDRSLIEFRERVLFSLVPLFTSRLVWIIIVVYIYFSFLMIHIWGMLFWSDFLIVNFSFLN